MSTPALSPSDLLASLQWRYATKAFDKAKTIPAEIWQALEESLVLSASSFGLQPWKFLVVTDPAIRAQLLPHSWGQKQVVEASHYVVFASVKKIDEAHIDRYFARTVELRGGALEDHKGYRGMMVGSLIQGGMGTTEWAVRQAYIALGSFMTAAALLKVDTCPMEGFIPAKYDEVLGLEARGLTAAVCCAVGYRSPDCKYATMPKIRFPAAEVVETI